MNMHESEYDSQRPNEWIESGYKVRALDREVKALIDALSRAADESVFTGASYPELIAKHITEIDDTDMLGPGQLLKVTSGMTLLVPTEQDGRKVMQRAVLEEGQSVIAELDELQVTQLPAGRENVAREDILHTICLGVKDCAVIIEGVDRPVKAIENAVVPFYLDRKNTIYGIEPVR